MYALSNFGSLAALLSYPFVFEPAFDLPRQSWLWSGAFVGYVLLCGLCAVWLWRCWHTLPSAVEQGPGGNPAHADCAEGDRERVSWPRRALWLLLPACASLMLLATTNHVCQDLAVVPFLWVVPLALYLLSFIICFDHPRWYVRGLWITLAAVAILVAADPDIVFDKLAAGLHGLNARFPETISINYFWERVIYFATMFLICMVCHGELMRLRPHPRRLTEYYPDDVGRRGLGRRVRQPRGPPDLQELLRMATRPDAGLRGGGGGNYPGRHAPGGPHSG